MFSNYSFNSVAEKVDFFVFAVYFDHNFVMNKYYIYVSTDKELRSECGRLRALM